jgi:hypothetical protein
MPVLSFRKGGVQCGTAAAVRNGGRSAERRPQCGTAAAVRHLQGRKF